MLAVCKGTARRRVVHGLRTQDRVQTGMSQPLSSSSPCRSCLRHFTVKQHGFAVIMAAFIPGNRQNPMPQTFPATSYLLSHALMLGN
ncbi:hypothetical protein BXY39_2550 [Eilatimonas milleporae]|uniref:Uncharacterized protein n=1 Tax=Eilatimonas milleporae TaxID=911205 RepID=A0A3M0CE10_9PROT|nr:hypothetical protein BXY39_2550 [Eilatimonas milleporae]